MDVELSKLPSKGTSGPVVSWTAHVFYKYGNSYLSKEN